MGSRHRVLSSSRHIKTIMTKAVFFSSVIALAAGMVALLLLNVEPSEAATSNLCKNTSVVNHDACKAFSTQYKCAVFYTDLETDSGNRPLSWIGGLPEPLATCKGRTSGWPRTKTRRHFVSLKPPRPAAMSLCKRLPTAHWTLARLTSSTRRET